MTQRLLTVLTALVVAVPMMTPGIHAASSLAKASAHGDVLPMRHSWEAAATGRDRARVQHPPGVHLPHHQPLVHAWSTMRAGGDGCPSPWSCGSVGSENGSASFDGTTWTISSDGNGIPNSPGWGCGCYESFHFVWQPLNGSGSISARLASAPNPGVYASTGLMLRHDSSTNAVFYFLGWDGHGNIVVRYRRAAGISAASITVSNQTLPVSLQIVRSGLTLSAQTSTDGSTWTTIPGSQLELSLPDPVMAGMADSAQGGAVFDTVQVSSSGSPTIASCPAPWTCQDIGSPGTAGSNASVGGSAWVSDGAGGLNTQGVSNDAFHFISQILAGNGYISGHLVHPPNASPSGAGNAQVGVMLRQSAAPLDPFYALFVQYNGTLALDYRRYAGARIESLAIGTITAPYIRIERSAVSYQAYSSADGSTWTAVPNSRIALGMTGAVMAGLVVADNSGGITTATFDSVMVTPETGPATASCASGWICADVGSPSTPGISTASPGANGAADAWALYGTGWGDTTSSDGFRYVYQQGSGSGFIKVHMIWVHNTSCYAQGGIMLRSSTDPGAPYYAAAMFPGHCGMGSPPPVVVVQDRTSQGASSGHATANYWGYALPSQAVWIQVSWSGDTFSTSYSTDGTSWQAVPDGTATIPAIGAPLMGLYANDGAGNGLGTAGFEGLETSNATNAEKCLAGDPINCATGTLLETAPGLSIPGRGLPLAFVPTYNGQNAAMDSPLGYGWTDPYNLFLTTDESGAITVHDATGDDLSFDPGSGGYEGPSWAHATLTRQADGTLDLHDVQANTDDSFTSPTPTAPGVLLRESDRNGYVTTLSYAGGALQRVTDPAGRSLTFAYNQAGYLTSITDPANRQMRFSYDSTGNLVDVQDVGGGHTHLGYDANHLLVTLQKPDQYPSGPVTTTIYDAQGRVTSQTDPLKRTTQFSYGQNSNGTTTTAITDPNGTVTTETFQGAQLVSETDGSGTSSAATWSYAYDPVTGNLAARTDPDGHSWAATYDANGNLLTSTDPLNRTTTYTYDSLNDITSVTDPMGHVTTFTYDAHGNLLTQSRQKLETNQVVTTTYSYGDPAHPGDITSITDPRGHTWTFTYDLYGDVASTTDPNNNQTTYTYSVISQLTSFVKPTGYEPGNSAAAYTTSYQRDAFGRPTLITAPNNEQTIETYDANGNLLSVTDPLGKLTQYSYDAADEVTTVTRPDGSTEQYTYDGNGNQLTWTDGLNHTTTYSLDPLNRVIAETDPLHRTTHSTYDGAGNLIAVQDAMNRTTTYSYDQANELTGITYSDGQTPNVRLQYNQDGQRTDMTDGTGTSTYSYDSLRELIESTDGAGSTVSYGYDLDGNLTSITYPGSLTVNRSYQANNLLASVTDWLGNTTSFGYDPDGTLQRETFPNGVTGAFTADANDAVTSMTFTKSGLALDQFTYSRDADEQVVAATSTLDASHSYSYDQLNRLIGDTPGAVTSYSYDAGDNLTAIGSTIQTFDAAHELTSSGPGTSGVSLTSRTFTFDPAGDRTSVTDSITNTQTTLGYDQEQRLTSYNGVASYRYNGDGLRISSMVNGSTTNFVWDLAEGMPLMVQAGATRYITGPSGLPIEQVDGSNTPLYYQQDQLGSTRALMDSTGNLVATFSYTPYGQLASKTGTVSTPFGYAGQYTDAESGLIYLRARYYDPSTGQFLTVDPLDDLTGEPYIYVDGDPTNLDDPTGLCGQGKDRYPKCSGYFYVPPADSPIIFFGRNRDLPHTRKGANPDSFAWDFVLSPADQTALTSIGGTVSAWVSYASVNNREVNSPYPKNIRHMDQVPGYHFHASMDSYQQTGRGGKTMPLKEGDILHLEWTYQINVEGATRTFHTEITCEVPFTP